MAGKRSKTGAPRNWRNRFIAALGETSNISAAADAAQISLSWVYKTRREDAEFARRWFEALCEGYDNLEMQLLEHLRHGETSEAKDAKRKFDTAGALRCLTAHREAVAREKGRRTLAGEVTTIAAINAKIDALRVQRKAGDKAIAKARAETRKAAKALKTGTDRTEDRDGAK